MAEIGLREILDEITSIVTTTLNPTSTTFPIQVERGLLLNPTPPSVDVYVTDPARDLEAAGFGDIAGGYQITVRARINSADNDAAQDWLLSCMDDTDDLCVPVAVLEDPTLNGKASGMRLVTASGHRAYETPDGLNAHLGCQFDFVVYPARS